MGCKTEPQVTKYGPEEASASQAMLRQEGSETSIPGAVDHPSIAPMVNQGSDIVPAHVNSGGLPPRVDRGKG